MHSVSLKINKLFFLSQFWGTWVVQLVKRPTLTQGMFSRFVSSSPASGSVLTVQSLEPALDSVSPSLSLSLSLSAPPPTCALSLSLSLSLKNK